MNAHPLDQLKPRGKPPANKQAIDRWIHDAEREVGIGARRFGWMVASGVVVAAIQRVLHTDGLPRFLIKGGAYLELRLGLRARAPGSSAGLRSRADSIAGCANPAAAGS